MSQTNSPASVPDTQCEVLVIGGGPAGSTAATLLAREGYSVTLLEKDHHPRFHIGESLLPQNLHLLKDLGVLEAVRAIGMPKYGAEFVSPNHDHTSPVTFDEAFDKSVPFAYQVRRADFDNILLRNAQTEGARVVEGAKVKSVEFDDQGASVTAELDDGATRSYRAQFVVDASGRDTFLASRLKSKARNPKHNSAAIFSHYENAERYEGAREGDISIFWFDHGWFWFIPLSDGTTSVGAVCWPYYLAQREGSLEDFLQQTINSCPKLAARLKNARRVAPVTATGNYSYASTIACDKRFVMLGDAFAFVDPVFSSGVLLAMQSAYTAMPVVNAALRHAKQPLKFWWASRRFTRHMRRGPREFSWFIYRVTNPTMRELFMAPRNVLGAKSAVLSVMAGDVFKNWAMRPSLAVFKAVYYITSAVNLPRTLRAKRQRALNIQPSV